jgi:hypothetical protein
MNAAEAQLEVASHLAEAQQKLERAVQACGDYFHLARISWDFRLGIWNRLLKLACARFGGQRFCLVLR